MLKVNSLPILSQASQEAEVKVIAKKSITVFRILVVDDVSTIRKLVRKKVESICLENGVGDVRFEVEEAKDGQEAVNKVKCNNGKGFEAIIMDIDMPVKNGYEATQEILSLNRQLLVIAFTGVTEKECLQKQPLFKAYVPKDQLNKLIKVLPELILSPKKDTLREGSPPNEKCGYDEMKSSLIKTKRSFSDGTESLVVGVSRTASPASGRASSSMSSVDSSPTSRITPILSVSSSTSPSRASTLSIDQSPGFHRKDIPVDKPPHFEKALFLGASTTPLVTPIASHSFFSSTSLLLSGASHSHISEEKSLEATPQDQSQKRQDSGQSDLSATGNVLQGSHSIPDCGLL